MDTTAAAETAAQNYMRAILAADYHMTPERAAAKANLLNAIAAAYPTLDNLDVFDMWSAGMMTVDTAARFVIENAE
jgi:hypothetical protein